jgi:hypothetical protein
VFSGALVTNSTIILCVPSFIEVSRFSPQQ